MRVESLTLQQSARLLDGSQVERTLTRLAHEIAERHRADGALVLAGIPTRGVPLASRVAMRVAQLGVTASVAEVDPGAFRDDTPRTNGTAAPAVRAAAGAALPSITGAAVVLVDDVLYTGRTVRAAIDALVSAGRPASVEVLVLIDRGHRELPLRATYVGKNVPTAMTDRVAVRLAEVDGVDGAWLVPGAPA